MFAACDLPMFAGARLFASPDSPMYLATADFNHDGITDVVVTSSAANKVSVLIGNGDGTFQPAVNYSLQNPTYVVAGDFNGDGKLDLAIDSAFTTVVMLGNGDGTFQAGIVKSGVSGAMAVGDFNHDGKLDLAVLSVPALVMLGNGDGTFQTPVFTSTNFQASFALAVGDFNNDGFLDVVVALSGGVGVMLGDGKGNLADPVSTGTSNSGNAPMQVAVGDVNGDGKLDVIALSPLDSNAYVLLGNGDGSLAPATAYAVGNFAGLATGLLAGDFNGDGFLDFAVANQPAFSIHGTISVFSGIGDGTFQPEVQYNPTSQVNSALGLGDFNGDGLPDIVFTSEVFGLPTGVGVMFGAAGGTFQSPNSYPVGPAPGAPVIADFNGDGFPDIAVTATGFSGNLSVLLGKGDGTYQPAANYPTAFGANGVVAADFNGDGKMDLAVANGTSQNILVFLGNGDGTFQSSIASGSVFGGASFLAAGDFNKDGKLDLAVSGLLGVQVLLGNGDGTFKGGGIPGITLGPPQGPLVAADLNGDGYLDLVVAAATPGSPNPLTSGNLIVMLGNGNGTFKPPVTYTAGTRMTSVAAGDLNGDGRLDVVATDYNGGTVAILLGNGDGTLQTPVKYPAVSGPNAVAIGDFDGDGIVDLAVASGGVMPSSAGVVTVMLGNGDGTFHNALSYGAGTEALGLAMGDLNGDGKPDLVFVDDIANSVGVLINNFVPGSSAAACSQVAPLAN